jgi:hypothetical protein
VQHQRFLVEIDRRTVGVAVRMPGGFMFFSSEDDFDRLDGKLFPRARMLERALRKMISPLGRAPAHRLAAA